MSAKWRPPLWSVVAGVLAIVLALPLSGLVFFRLYENQFVRQTEAELIAQGTAIAAFYAADLARTPPADEALGPQAPASEPAAKSRLATGPYDPHEPTLDLATATILPSRPEAKVADAAVDPAHLAAGAHMTPLLASIQKSTLAGFRALDARGTVVAGRDEIGLSLAHVPEVADALAGRYTSVIRVRETDEPPPPLYSISRGTRIRVFVAVPVLLNDRVAGVVYVSRTPNHILRHLYGERGKVALWVAFVLAGTALAGLMLMRMVTRPVNALLDRTVRLSAGDRSALQALETNGTREMAALADGLLSMAGRLQERSDYIRSFASHVSHELKSPLTAISGAAELLRDQGAAMSDSERARFAANIAEDAVRLDRLVARLRDHARAETAIAGSEATRLADAVASMAAPEGIAIEMRIPTDMSVAMSAETIGIVLANLADNAASHGTKTLTFAARAADGRATITVSDDGTGISPGNRGRVFEPFFTTRREEGGTGMGLHIVKTLIEAHGGSIRLLDVAKGAAFEITLPLGA